MITESSTVRSLLRNHSIRNRYEFMLPNCYTQFDNEADVFAVRRSGFCDEFEIKVTRSDFMADRLKTVKYGPKMDALADGKMVVNYFWYVVPRGLVGLNELPDFAGLIEVRESGLASEIRKPARLHRKKATESYKYRLAQKMSYRYWNLWLEHQK